MRLYRQKLLERKEIGGHVLLRYEWSGPEPEPGQFVGARAGGSLDPFLPRPFFVHDRVHDRGEGDMSILFKVRGRGTAALAGISGDIQVSAPRGRGFGVEPGVGSALVGGGVWVAPLKFLSRRLRERGVEHGIYLEAPSGAPEEYLRWLEEAYPGAEFLPTDGSPGAIVRALPDLGGYAAVYVSGDRDTLSGLADIRPDAQLAVRERMACMDGSCYGCVVPVRSGAGVSYRRTCVEGPVFVGRELAW